MAKRKSSNLFGILVIIMGIVAGYIYYTSIAQSAFVVPPPIAKTYNDLIKFKDISFDLDILNDEDFSRLRVFGESPVRPGITGKVDLFAPF